MAYEPGYGHPTRPRRTLRSTLLLVGVALLVCCVGATGLGLWNLQAVRRSVEPARRVAEAFLGDLTVGDAPAAYDRLCVATRDRWQRLEFVRWVAIQPQVSQYAVDDVSVVTSNGQLRATVTARLTHESGKVVTHALPVVREDGDWRVCGDPY
jgi:Domain of unknown function (DUF4878)